MGTHQRHHRIESFAVTDLHTTAPLLGQLHQLLRLPRRRGNRLFDQDVLARLQTGFCDGIVA